MPRAREAQWSRAAALEALQHRGDDEMRAALVDGSRRFMPLGRANAPETLLRRLSRPVC